MGTIKVSSTSERVVSFRGLRKMAASFADEIRNKERVLLPDVHEHSLLDEIFAPDPVTGNPNSELYIRLQGNPDVRQYIDHYMSQQILVPKVGEDDVDVALELQKTRYESAAAYLDRVKKIQGLKLD